MRPQTYQNFSSLITRAEWNMLNKSSLVHSARWQGVDIVMKPEMAMHELTHLSFAVSLEPVNEFGELRGNYLGVWQEDIKPNLPWADKHFDERVCGAPINPGVEWENWPYNKSAATFLEDGKFNHNYMERYWPKYAGFTRVSKTAEEYFERVPLPHVSPHVGIKYEYGDLNDVVELLANDPHTRQAYLPVWFPEDTGGGSKRAPCTIGYHFLMREGKFDINYEIRSCDFVRHFRDDLYLTARLLLWVLEQCRVKNPEVWQDVTLGKFYMQIGSLHMFRNDMYILAGSQNGKD